MPDDIGREHVTPATISFEAVARVSKASTLREIVLTSSSAELRVSRQDVPAGWAEQAFVGYDSHSFPEPDGRFSVRVAFIAVYLPSWDARKEGSPPDLDADDASVEIDARFELSYDPSDDAHYDAEDLEHFAFVNGTMHAWPYWREFAQSMSMRMGIEPIVIHTYKIPWVGDPQPAAARDA